MLSTGKIIIAALFIFLFSESLFCEDEAERIGKIIKIRTSGVCYLDPGITDDEAKLIAKFDGVQDALFRFGVYFKNNDSLITVADGKSSVKYISNLLNTTVYKEGEESIDGYPAYVSYISCEVHLDVLNGFLLEAVISNQFRYQLVSEYKRMSQIFEDINSLKETTNKIPENFISGLTERIVATEWANKAVLTDETGLKLEFYSIAIDHDNMYESAYLSLSDVLIKVNRYGEVLGLLNKLINYDALKFPAVYTKRGEVYFLQKLYSVALKELEKAVAIDPKYAEAYCQMGSVYAALNKNDEALAKFRQAISIDKDLYKTYYTRGNFFRKNGKYDEAITDYNSAIDLNTKSTESYMNRALTNYLVGNYQKAIEDYTRAIYLDELSPVLYYNRAVSYRKLSDIQKASDDYKTYLLLTVKDINKEKYSEMIKAWMEDDRYKPVIQD